MIAQRQCVHFQGLPNPSRVKSLRILWNFINKTLREIVRVATATFARNALLRVLSEAGQSNKNMTVTRRVKSVRNAKKGISSVLR